MEPYIVRPERAQLNLWFLKLFFTYSLVMAGCVAIALLIHDDKAIIGYFLCMMWTTISIIMLFWIPAYYKSLEYIIDKDSLKANRGVFWRKQITIPYSKITNLDIKQGPVERMMNIGAIDIQTAGYSGDRVGSAELTLQGVHDLDGVKDRILERMRSLTLSSVSPAPEKTVPYTNVDILKNILEELKSIRNALENR